MNERSKRRSKFKFGVQHSLPVMEAFLRRAVTQALPGSGVEAVGDGYFYIHAIAVDKEVRGDGVGSVLMDSFEERARATGSTRLSLDVFAKNEGARRFYKRRGMTVESQWPQRLAIPGLKFYRMTTGL